jgi:hypothetical protein
MLYVHKRFTSESELFLPLSFFALGEYRLDWIILPNRNLCLLPKLIYRVHESKDEYCIAQKDTQPSQTCSGGFIKTQLYAICCCFFAIGEYNLIQSYRKETTTNSIKLRFDESSRKV